MATHIDAVFLNEDREASLTISVYFVFLGLSQISPVIDGTGVVQGTLLTPDIGPVVCVVSFAADDEEDFRQVAVIPPWEMMIHAVEQPDDVSASADDDNSMGFTIPLDLASFQLGEGSVEINVYVDRIVSIPYSDIDSNFDLTVGLYTPALKWTTRSLSQADVEQEADNAPQPDVLVVELPDEGSFADDDMPSEVPLVEEMSSSSSNLIVQEVRIAIDYDELMQARQDGFVVCCEQVDTFGGELAEEQEQLWKFHICTKLGPADLGGVEDVVFLKTQKSLGTLPTLKDYTVFHEIDLTEFEDDVSVIIY